MPLDWHTVLRDTFQSEDFVPEDSIRIRRGLRIQTTIDVYSRHGHSILVVGEIQVVVSDPIAPQVDELFGKLYECLTRFHQARGRFPAAIVLRGGGLLQVPDFFIDFCRRHGIAIVYAADDHLFRDGKKIPIEDLLGSRIG